MSPDQIHTLLLVALGGVLGLIGLVIGMFVLEARDKRRLRKDPHYFDQYHRSQR